MDSDKKVISYKEHAKNSNTVFKKKGCGNKYYNAFTVTYFFNREESCTGKIKDIPYVVICIRDEQGRETVTSGFTKAIYDNWGGNEVNSQYTRAVTLVKFLNWILIKRRSRYPNLRSWSELTLSMAIDYLNSVRHDVVYERHMYIENTLRGVYKVLAENGMLKEMIIGNINKDTFKKLGVKRAGRRSDKGNISHNIPKVIIMDLIRVSEKETPDITLGLILGICGGIRVGELVNLSTTSIKPLGIDEFILYIQDRYFRKDISSPRVRGEVKKQRKQRIYRSVAMKYFGEDKLNETYYSHINKYKAQNNTNALFVDTKGNPMTAQTFMNRFVKLKKKFIEYLGESDDDLVNAYGKALEKKKWKTHILRGVFSNAIAEITKSPLSTALARADEQFVTALNYVTDTDEVNQTMEMAVQMQRRENFIKKPLPITEFRPKLDSKDGDDVY